MAMGHWYMRGWQGCSVMTSPGEVRKMRANADAAEVDDALPSASTG